MTKPLVPDASSSGHITALHFRTRALAVQVADQAMCLSIAHGAYAALEKLLTPENLDELQEDVGVPRCELGALLNIVNADFKRQIQGLTDATVELASIATTACSTMGDPSSNTAADAQA